MNSYKVKLAFASIGILITIFFMFISTYAYITMNDNGNEIDEILKEFYEVINVKYNDTSNVSLVNAHAGDSIVKTFTIKNIGGKAVYYNILLDDLVNNFVNIDDLVFSLSSESGALVSQTAMPNTEDSLIASNVLINSGTTHSYIMTITFLKTTEDQSNNENKIFSSNIKILPSSKEYNMLYEKNTLGNKILVNNTFTSESNINYKTSSSENGLYYTNNSINGSTVYFFRGKNDELNNNIIFANYCWKILRTTEDLGIRIIYNGTYENGVCNNNVSIQNTSLFNNNSNYNAYVGYMYGSVNGSSYKNEHTNTNSSIIKSVLDSWYSTNLSSYSSYIKDSYYCNNRKTTKFRINNVVYGVKGYSNENTGYQSVKRLSLDTVRPSYNCYNKNDIFTVSDIRGNMSLANPVGLITADELVFAGYTTINNNYLYSLGSYWTMTPAYFNGSIAYNYIFESNKLLIKPVDSSYSIRPVITLKHDVKVSSGNGSLTSPYKITN